MPIYEYICSTCGQLTETLQKFSDPPLSDCPQCGGRLEKMMSLNSFHLKGGGWYVTDYKGSTASSDGGSKTDGGSVGEGKAPSSPIAAAAKAVESGARPAAKPAE